ncbi:hypothetical protein BGW36DRAFT_357438 [Talaromyces proteolyticus]|uniref:Uncharacterized protein n=1 Tax=Talaromyces proteolyticus TaxID=1131652 RepID=A0AAD4KVK1_9EURO|nr:uncharacterized protein BGW36DRAFT_357438 [Talaromyces proteolyticus]KAH8700794.1 hypothetical protein BGW36DRAFT_357438 [Talaromyces proteolyticus]
MMKRNIYGPGSHSTSEDRGWRLEQYAVRQRRPIEKGKGRTRHSLISWSWSFVRKGIEQGFPTLRGSVLNCLQIYREENFVSERWATIWDYINICRGVWVNNTTPIRNILEIDGASYHPDLMPMSVLAHVIRTITNKRGFSMDESPYWKRVPIGGLKHRGRYEDE